MIGSILSTPDPKIVDAPEGTTPWKGRHLAPLDYINGPVWLRDGTQLSMGYRHTDSQWTWYGYDSLFGQAPDDIVAYMPGYIKPWVDGEEAPDDWDGGPVLWGDGTIWSEGLQRNSIGWFKQPHADRSSIVAYTSIRIAPLEERRSANPAAVIMDSDHRLQKNNETIVADLGYIAASGFVVRAVRLHRAIYGSGLLEAKRIVQTAAASAKHQHHIPKSSRE